MLDDLVGSLKERYDFYRHPTTFVGADTDDISEHYEWGREAHEKEAQMYALQLAVDAYADGDISRDEYLSVQESAREHVENYFLTGKTILNCFCLKQIRRRNSSFWTGTMTC
ncbi:MAG: hypothetical protein ABEJ99_04485 [Candidatus Nanohaloarchaea archaeon]